MSDELLLPAVPRPGAAIVRDRSAVAGDVFICIAIVGSLYFGRAILVPAVIAGLVSFVLAPLVLFFRRIRAGRIGAVVAAVTLVLFLITCLAGVILQQMAELVTSLPAYEHTIGGKLRSLQGIAARPVILDELTHLEASLGDRGSPPHGIAPSATQPRSVRHGPAGTPAEPVTVEIQNPTSVPFETMASFAGPLFGVMVDTGVVAVFVLFMLIFREDLRDRFLRLAGASDLGRTSAAMDDAGRRLSRYFLMQSAVNTCFGILIGTGLWLIGIPNPVLWGMVAGLFRFVPYVGAVLAAVLPALLAVAVGPHWSMLLWTLGLYAGVELILGQMIEPLLYGHHTGLSPVAVLVAAAFWTWLWGPVGLLLSTPVTVCVLVLGRHVERFGFLSVLLGDQPALTPQQSFIQRMLAGDPYEAADQAEQYLKKHFLFEYYDSVAVPGLLAARLEMHRGGLNLDHLARVRDTVRNFVEDLGIDGDEPALPQERAAESDSNLLAAECGNDTDRDRMKPLPVATAASLAPAWQGERPVMCVGARDPLDEAAAIMLAQLFDRHGLESRVEPATTVTPANLFKLDPAPLAAICVLFLGGESAVHQRYLIRRLRRRAPDALIVIVSLEGVGASAAGVKTHGENIAVRETFSFQAAVRTCIEAARPIPDNDGIPDTGRSVATV